LEILDALNATLVESDVISLDTSSVRGTATLTAGDAVDTLANAEFVAGQDVVITLQDVFLFDFSAGVDPEGRFLGQLQPTGVRPKFAEKLADRGLHLGPEIFTATPAGSPR